MPNLSRRLFERCGGEHRSQLTAGISCNHFYPFINVFMARRGISLESGYRVNIKVLQTINYAGADLSCEEETTRQGAAR